VLHIADVDINVVERAAGGFDSGFEIFADLAPVASDPV